MTIALAACTLLAACGDKKNTNSNTPPASSADGLEAVALQQMPDEALSITEIRKDITPGKKITMKGKVMGRKDPFVEGRAILILGDPAIITSCDLREGDTCTTPWDVCCDDADDIKNSVATIQVLDANGKLLKQGLKGFQGIKELSHLVITGTIAEGSNKDNLLINATGIFVQPQG